MVCTAAVLHAGEEKLEAETGSHPCALISFVLANVKTIVIRAPDFVMMIKRMMFKALVCRVTLRLERIGIS